MTEGDHEKNPNSFGQHRNLNSEFFEYGYYVMNFDRRNALCIQNFITDRIWKSAKLEKEPQPLQRCYCEN